MNFTRQRQGEIIIFGGAVLWSLFPVITYLSLNNLPALLSLSLSSFFSIIFFCLIMTKKGLWHELKNRKALKDILLGTLFIGVTYYLLVFLGLQYTSPGNASIIGLTEILFSFLFFHVLRKEYIPTPHIYGAILMVFGALIILASSFNAFHLGDILIFSANIVAPIGNFFQQRARKQVASETIMFIRSVLSTLIIFMIVFVMQTSISLQAIQGSLIFLLINGLLLLGFSKILWLEGIHRISVTKASALGSIEPFLTLTFAYLLLHQVPTIWQLTSIFPIIVGVFLLSKQGVKQQITPIED